MYLLAQHFVDAEAERSAQRSRARSFALAPDMPGVLEAIELQLQLTEVTGEWSELEVDDDAVVSARAAVLDMGLVIASPLLPVPSAADLAEPWISTV